MITNDSQMTGAIGESLVVAELIKKELRKGTKAEEICVIAPQWFMLFDLSGKLRLLLPDISFDAPDISPIKYLSLIHI